MNFGTMMQKGYKLIKNLAFYAIAFSPLVAVAVQNPIEAKSFLELSNVIIKFIRDLLAPVAAIIVLYAAFLYMSSAGNVEKVKKAHRAFLWAVVGIGVVLFAQSIVAIIENTLKGK